MKDNRSRANRARQPEDKGCDVRLTVSPEAGQADALDVRLEPKVEDLVEALEDDEEHTLPIDAWSNRLRQIDPQAFGDRPKPRRPALVEPGTEAKIQIMQERIARGEDPFGPTDLGTDSNDQAGREIRRCRNGRDERGGLRQLGEAPKGGDAA